MDVHHGTPISEHLCRVAWWDLVGADQVNCDVFAVDCGEAVVLIDAGRGGPAYPLMRANLAHWALLDRLRVCLLTHLHRDHAGGAAPLQADGVAVWGGPGAAAYGQSEAGRAYWEGQVPEPDRVLRDGECFVLGDIEFEAMATPGHTSTCVTYLATIDGRRCAFSGDAVMPNGTTGYTGSFDFSAEQLLASLERLAAREFDALFTGHLLSSSQPEGFWLQNGHAAVQRTLAAGRAGQWPRA